MNLDTFFKKSIAYLFHFLLIATPLVWTVKMSELFEFPKMLFVYAMTVIIATAWIARMITQQRFFIQKTFFDKPLLIFLLSQVAATLFSIDPHTSLYGYYSRFHGGLLSTIAYITLYYAFVSNIDTKSAHKLLKSTVISGVLASLYALPEHFGKAFSCMGLGQGWTTECWSADTNPKNRSFGTFGQPNWLAAYLITMIFIPLSSALKMTIENAKKKGLSLQLNRGLSWLIAVLFFSVLLFTKSRSGILGLVVGLGIFSLGTFISTKAKTAFIIAMVMLFSVFSLFYSLFGKGIIPQIDAIFNRSQSTIATSSASSPKTGTVLDTGGTESYEIRKIVWQGAVDVFRHHPFFGSGVETFGYSYYNFRPANHNLTSEWDFLYNKAHNEWLNFLANSGIFGLGTYLFLMASFVFFCIKKAYENHDKASLLYGLLAGYSALAVSNYYGFSTVPVGILFFLFPAFAVLLSENRVEEPHPTDVLSTWQNIVVFVGILTCFFGLYRVYAMYTADRAYVSGNAYANQNQLQTALSELEQAIRLMPSEPLYKDEFAQTAATAALTFYEQKQATAGAKVAALAIEASDQALAQNSVHLNFYKTRTRMLANLGVYNPKLMDASIETLKKAISLAPTDAKLYYSLGMIYLQKQDLGEAQKSIEQAIALKSNYEQARFSLGELFESQKSYSQAKEQFDYILTHIAPGNTKAKTKSEALQQMVK